MKTFSYCLLTHILALVVCVAVGVVSFVHGLLFSSFACTLISIGIFQLRLYIDKYRHLLQHVPHPAENGGEPEADHRLSETEGFQRYRSAGLC